MSKKTLAYGVKEQESSGGEAEQIAELIRLQGYAVYDSGYLTDTVRDYRDALMAAQDLQTERFGADYLASIGETAGVRAPLAYDARFLEMARHPLTRAVCGILMGEYFVLNQQNGAINPPEGEEYGQRALHRDLPYQHWVSSRPLALNALFCLDNFTVDNGATSLIPGSHRVERFPSESAIAATQKTLEAPAGSVILLDCMVYHAAGHNATLRHRCAVNHVFSIPILRQQISLPDLLQGRYSEDPEVARFLGYDVRVPRSVEDFFRQRESKRG